MNKLEVVAIKISQFPESTRVIYRKRGKLYIRTGEDGFLRGKPLQSTIEGACYKWGFYKVENPPTFRDGQELMDNIGRFNLKFNGLVTYSPNPLR